MDVNYLKYIKYKNKYLQAKEKINAKGGWLLSGTFIIFYNSKDHENVIHNAITNLEKKINETTSNQEKKINETISNLEKKINETTSKNKKIKLQKNIDEEKTKLQKNIDKEKTKLQKNIDEINKKNINNYKIKDQIKKEDILLYLQNSYHMAVKKPKRGDTYRKIKNNTLNVAMLKFALNSLKYYYGRLPFLLATQIMKKPTTVNEMIKKLEEMIKTFSNTKQNGFLNKDDMVNIKDFIKNKKFEDMTKFLQDKYNNEEDINNKFSNVEEKLNCDKFLIIDAKIIKKTIIHKGDLVTDLTKILAKVPLNIIINMSPEHEAAMNAGINTAFETLNNNNDDENETDKTDENPKPMIGGDAGGVAVAIGILIIIIFVMILAGPNPY